MTLTEQDMSVLLEALRVGEDAALELHERMSTFAADTDPASDFRLVRMPVGFAGSWF